MVNYIVAYLICQSDRDGMHACKEPDVKLFYFKGCPVHVMNAHECHAK